MEQTISRRIADFAVGLQHQDLPQEVAEVAAASGVTPDDVRGLVKSVTYRAYKR